MTKRWLIEDSDCINRENGKIVTNKVETGSVVTKTDDLI